MSTYGIEYETKNQLVNHTREEKCRYLCGIVNEPRNAIEFLYDFAVVGKIDTFCQREVDSSAGAQERTKAG